jgi:Ni/Co efflux regulator RcnB
VVLGSYYDEQFRAGRCPPGLAKKHNGCMPPGQAKKWNVGQPLPQGVVYYTVPQPLVLQFGQPPSGYRYVRVGSDVLLMAIGTRMIVDALQGRS